MGMSRLEYQYHRDRLRFPLKRTAARGEGKWQRISWDEAYDTIAESLTQSRLDSERARWLLLPAGVLREC